MTELGMSVRLHFCFIWKINECSFGFLTTFLLEKVPSGVKNATVLKKCLKTAKNGLFFYKNNEISSLSFKKFMLSIESHYSAKAPQNMRYKEQKKIKKTLLFQIYHTLIFFEKCTHFTIFVNFLRFLAIFCFWRKN